MVRSDLPLGFLTAQVAHAASESSLTPDPLGTNVVVLAVPSEAMLLAVYQRLVMANVRCVLITEPDAPWDGAATAIGVERVDDRKIVKRVLQHLPLLGSKEDPP